MLTPEQYAETAARWHALQKEARPLADAMEETRAALFAVTITRPTGEQLGELIRGRDPRNTARYFAAPHTVPVGAWVNVAPAVWKQRTQ